LCQAQGIPAAVLSSYRQPNSQARAFVGGNQDLKPETADTYTFGVSWQPKADSRWLQRLALSVDYFDYEIQDVIGALTASSVVGRCFNQLNSNPTFDPNNEFCRTFVRNSASFAVTDVDTTSTNLGGLKTTGIDLNLNWGVPLAVLGASDRAGDLAFRLIVTHLLSFEQQETDRDEFLAREGTISQTVASAYPVNKGVLATTWSIGTFEIRHNMRYVSAMDVVNNDAALTTPTVGVRPHVPSYLYHDLTVRWTPNDTLGVTIGVTNIGDKDPPIYTTDSQAGIQSNTDPSTYDVLGRRYFLNLAVSF
jgi:outer membrane receptor protein involved in Fe transport